MMNSRKAGPRVLIVIAVLWSAFWGWTFHDATRSAEAGDRPRFFNGKRLEAGEFEREQNARRDNALRFGLGGLAALLAMLLLLGWLSRRPEDP